MIWFYINVIIETLSCGLAPNKTGYIITNFAEIGSGQLLTIQVISENPALPANYTIEAFSYSPEYKAKVDYGFTSISIDDKCKFFPFQCLLFPSWIIKILQFTCFKMDSKAQA